MSVLTAAPPSTPCPVAIQGVSKRFILQHERHRAFQDMVVNLFRPNGRKSSQEEFWALKNVTLHIGRGEMVGIVGQNGSGKSTLLKLMAGIIQPTEGKIDVRGRISALLELGAGFHPELTGRDNVYLNGSLLGFSRREIDRKFDDIVQFAEIEQFIDTPIKHYSSGMYMRLAFAVAINVDPDVLIADEVLAVGDAGFVRKCLQKVREFQERGTTIVLVTHDLATVVEMCGRAIWLSHGQIVADGPPPRVVEQYVRSVG